MKGITPVIAVILLLLITISMVGFAFVWFTRLSDEAQRSISEQQNATTSAIAKKIKIDNLGGIPQTALALRNIGTLTIDKNELGFFVGGISATCASVEPSGWTKIDPSSVATCTLSTACATGQRLRVTAPAGPDEIVCR